MTARSFLSLGVLLLATVGCDQVSKQAAVRWLSDAPPSSYLGDTFRLAYMENTGAFLGLGSDWPEAARWLAFTVVAALLVAGALWLLLSRMKAHPFGSPTVLGLALIVAGGVGNLIDRVVRDGAVVDFMNLGIGALRTGIFNVADVYIMAGAALWFLGERRAENAEAH